MSQLLEDRERVIFDMMRHHNILTTRWKYSLAGSFGR